MIIDTYRDGVYLWTDSNVTSIKGKGKSISEICRDIYSRVVQPRETVNGKIVYDQLYELYIDISGYGMDYKNYLMNMGLVVHEIRPKNIDIILPVRCNNTDMIFKTERISDVKQMFW